MLSPFHKGRNRGTEKLTSTGHSGVDGEGERGAKDSHISSSFAEMDGWPAVPKAGTTGRGQLKLLEDVCFLLDTVSFRDPKGMSDEQVDKQV